MNVGRRRLWLAALVAGTTACASVTRMRGELDGLKKVTDQAEQNGAMKCAPRELAVARANITFASTELDQGGFLKAQEHLAIAQANAHAALENSPPKECAERGIDEAPKPDDCDSDGIIDGFDKCKCEPETFNGFEDKDGCPDDPDTDMDGLVDSADMCPLVPEDKDNYLDEDGCPDPDNDLDGILDTADRDASGKSCANDPEDPDGYEDQDGCPEPDNDGDTVADLDDLCPMEPGPAGGDQPGCPKQTLAIVTDKEIRITQQIHFDFNKDKIKAESYPILDAVTEIMMRYPKIKLEIQGHTDNKGSPQLNRGLSDRRAAAVRKYLVAKGIDSTRLTSKGYGMERPIVPNNSDANRALNRRVQFMRTEGK